MLEKVERAYKGHVDMVLDVVRSSLIVETARQAKEALELLQERAVVHLVKNRYDLSYDGSATAGYRDINMQISFKELEDTPFCSMVFELQIIFASFLEIKSDEGHARYIYCRNLRGD